MNIAGGRTRVLANRQLLLLVLAYAGSAIVEWALWIAVLVYSFERGGSTAAGFAAILLLVPAALVAPTAARAADGTRPEHVLLVVYIIQAGSLLAAGVLADLGVPVVVFAVVAAVPIAGITFIRPSLSVVVPGIVVSPSDLVAANLLTGNADSASVLVGPLLAGALLAVNGPPTVLVVCAAISLVCVAMTWPVARHQRVNEFERPRPMHRGATHDLLEVVRSMSQRRGVPQLMLVLGVQYALIGSMDLLYVNLAFGVLDLDDAGAGFLNAAFGAGALVGGLLSVLVIMRRRLAMPMLVALGVVAFAMGGLGGRTTLIVTLIVLPVAGMCRSLLDVSGRMLLQRSASQDVLASVFAVVEVVAGLGILCGSLLVMTLVAVSGVEAALFGVGALFLVVCVSAAPGLRDADARADAPVVEIRLLRTVPLFAPLPGPALELLARACRQFEFASGSTIMREGDVGDSYYVIADGLVEVTVDGNVMRTLRRSDGFGEIALLAGLPRTATVTALTATSTLVIERSSFLSAVIGHDASAVIAWAVARRLHPPLAADGF